jgi:hypothetical protein
MGAAEFWDDCVCDTLWGERERSTQATDAGLIGRGMLGVISEHGPIQRVPVENAREYERGR